MTLSRNGDCIFTVIFDPAYDLWHAVKVYRDGNPIDLDKFEDEDEAWDFVDALREEYDEATAPFGAHHVSFVVPKETEE